MFRYFVFCLSVISATSAFAEENAVGYEEYYEQAAGLDKKYQENRIGSAEFLKKIKDPEVVIIDLRSQADYDAVHITNAINVNASNLTEEVLSKYVKSKDQTIIIYCDESLNIDRIFSRMIALTLLCYPQLQMHGYTNVFVLNLAEYPTLHLEDIPFEYDPDKAGAAGKVSQKLIAKMTADDN